MVGGGGDGLPLVNFRLLFGTLAPVACIRRR